MVIIQIAYMSTMSHHAESDRGSYVQNHLQPQHLYIWLSVTNITQKGIDEF